MSVKQKMKHYNWFYPLFTVLIFIPTLACGPSLSARVTPTPTKTPKPIATPLPTSTSTPVAIILPTATPIPPTATFTPEPPTATFTPEPPTAIPTEIPPTDTSTPEPEPPTNTPRPQPQATNTPVPAPPTDTPVPAPAAPTSPPAQQGPQVIIEMPDGDTYSVGDNIVINITVRDSNGISAFSWGVFAQNRSALKNGSENCNGAPECSITVEVVAGLSGQFEVGVEAKNKAGGGTIQTKQIYVG